MTGIAKITGNFVTNIFPKNILELGIYYKDFDGLFEILMSLPKNVSCFIKKKRFSGMKCVLQTTNINNYKKMSSNNDQATKKPSTASWWLGDNLSV